MMVLMNNGGGGGKGVAMVVEGVVMLHTYGNLRRYLRRYLYLRANQDGNSII